MLLRRALWQLGARFRLDTRVETSRPDIAFVGRRLAVFVDGCFWHGCPDHYVRPRTRLDFWSTKLRQNVLRDVEQTQRLEAAGWSALRFWEHEVEMAPERCAKVVLEGAQRARKRRFWRVKAARQVDGDVEEWTLTELRGLASDRVVRKRRSTRKWPRRAH